MPTPKKMMHPGRRIVCVAAISLSAATWVADSVQAQIVAPSVVVSPNDPMATLSDQLINQLRATRQDQRDYIAIVIEKVNAKKLDTRLIIAVKRYAMKRNPAFPFPYFERALQYESAETWRRSAQFPRGRIRFDAKTE